MDLSQDHDSSQNQDKKQNIMSLNGRIQVLPVLLPARNNEKSNPVKIACSLTVADEKRPITLPRLLWGSVESAQTTYAAMHRLDS